jgi:hypothetical protein
VIILDVKGDKLAVAKENNAYRRYNHITAWQSPVTIYMLTLDKEMRQTLNISMPIYLSL